MNGAVQGNLPSNAKRLVASAPEVVGRPFEASVGASGTAPQPSVSNRISSPNSGSSVQSATGTAAQHSVEDWGGRVRAAMQSEVASDREDALGLLSVCKNLPSMRTSFSEFVARGTMEASKQRALGEHLDRTAAACQTIDEAVLQSAPKLALRHFESQAQGAAVRLISDFPTEAAKVSSDDLYSRLRRDAFAGDERSIGHLALHGDAYSMPREERVGFQLAAAKLADESGPSAGGYFSAMVREVLGALTPGAFRISEVLLEAVAVARVRRGAD